MKFRRMMVVLVFIVAASMCSCSHKFTLFPRDGGEQGKGVANEIGKKVTITLGDKTYTGTYVYGGGSIGFVNSFGSAAAFSGTNTATAFGTGFGTTYMPGSGNGRVLAFSEDGDAIRCEFLYQSGGGLGVCEDNKGKLYDLQIHN